jgi:hypothetical protein
MEQRFAHLNICYTLVLRCYEEMNPCFYNNVLEPLLVIQFLTRLHHGVIFYLLLPNSYVFPIHNHLIISLDAT